MSRDMLSPGHVSAGQPPRVGIWHSAVGVLSSPGITQVSPGEAEGPHNITYYVAPGTIICLHKYACLFRDGSNLN